MIAAKRLGAIRFYNGERALQSKIAGLIWSPSYSIGNAFYEARNALPQGVRKAAFDRYVEDPYDGAAPSAIARALASLKRGELLSPDSTRRLLWIMGNTKTGANRLKGGLKPGWTLSHKTGTGQVLGAYQAGYNDIGIAHCPRRPQLRHSGDDQENVGSAAHAHGPDEQCRPRGDRAAPDAARHALRVAIPEVTIPFARRRTRRAASRARS